jgi:hypothetical protein
MEKEEDDIPDLEWKKLISYSFQLIYFIKV